MSDKPPVVAELVWSHDLEFGATSGASALVIDGNSASGPSPVQLLAMALASCMSSDIVDILKKGRHQLTGFRAKVSGERAPEPPRRLVAVSLEFSIHGNAPTVAVERAIALSREKYCSVWHSLRQDITFSTTFQIHP
jgi:putative redox protein